MRKLILILLILAVGVAGGLYAASRKTPALLRESIGRAINKTVQIQAIEYRFPSTFELRGFKILETREPFAGETCFAAGRVLVDVSPLSLSRNRLVLDSVEVNEAEVVIRNRNGKLLHALSDAMTGGDGAQGPSGPAPEAVAEKGRMPLKIHRFHLSRSRFRFVDYDVRSEGFVIELDQIEADIRDAAFPPSGARTTYRMEARLPQGRQQRPASFQGSGWTVFADYETDAFFRVNDLLLPYFRPYYSQVTAAEIEDGRLSSHASLLIREKRLSANVDLELSDLFFRAYEEGDELFGLKAEEILSFLKDSAGKLKFQIALEWDLAQRGVEKRDVVRRAIERSLKKTLLGNVGNILERTIEKLADGGLEKLLR